MQQWNMDRGARWQLCLRMQRTWDYSQLDSRRRRSGGHSWKCHPYRWTPLSQIFKVQKSYEESRNCKTHSSNVEFKKFLQKKMTLQRDLLTFHVLSASNVLTRFAELLEHVVHFLKVGKVVSLTGRWRMGGDLIFLLMLWNTFSQPGIAGKG